MPRGKDIAWKFVDELERGRWRCPYCEKIYRGQVTRVKSHFLEIPNRGISLCTKVPQPIRELMQWLLDQVRNKEDIAWKFVERLGDDRWRCHHCKEELFGDATGVKDHLLQDSNEGISICPKLPDTIRKLMQSLLKEAAEEESREVNGQSSTEPRHLVICQPGITTASACPQDQVCLHPGNMPPENLGTAQQTNLSNHRLDAESVSSPSITSDPSEPRELLHQSTPCETGNEEQNLRGLSSFPNDHVLGNSTSNGQWEHGGDSPIYSRGCSVFGDSLLEDPEYRDRIVHTSDERRMNELPNPTAESLLQNDSSLDVNGSKRLQDCSQPCGAEVVPVCGNTSPTYPVQHLDQLHPRCDKESGNNIRSFASQTPVDMDPSIVSQHTSDSHNNEATAVDLQVPEAATNATGPSSSQAPVPPQRQSVPHQSINNETSNAQQNTTVPSSSSSQAPPSPPIPPCGTSLPGPSLLPDMNEGAPMASHPNTSNNFEEHRALKRKLEKLSSRVAGIRKELKFAASLSVKKQRREVENWLPDAEKLIEDYIQAASKGCLPPHEVNKLKRKAEDLLRQGKFPKGLFRARETKVSKFLEGKMVGEAFKRNTTKILEYLVGNQVSRLGIYGMGGVGKTTIMMHIHNRLLEKANYGKVLWITVSKDFNTHKLQDDIWKALGPDTLQETDVRKRAAMLHDRLTKRGKLTLILDDVWEHFDLEELGIPIRADGFQMALTTRSFCVCRQMQCQENIKIEPLSQEEAESLFLEELGSEQALSLESRAVVKSIVEECAGLPLGVITIARSMRGVTELFRWKDFLVKLKESSMGQTDMEKKVLIKLKFSYDGLGNHEIQQCFLSCALYPEDELIDKLELIELFIDQGLIGELDTRQQQYNRGLTILSILENVCLLEDHEKKMKMHDLIRDMALNIISATSMVKARKKLTRIPPVENWTDALEKVSLMKNYFGEFPLDMSPNCPKLSTLLLNGSLALVSVIPNSFFKRLWGLEHLNLSGCSLTELPNSFSDLVNLRALLLRDCWTLRHIPYVGKLTSLRKLDVQGCGNLEEIEGLKKLVNLRYIDLYGTGIKRLPKGMLGVLLKLQYLKVEAPTEVDIAKLAALETLGFCCGDADDFNKWTRVIGQKKRCQYNLTVKSFPLLFKVELSDDNPFGNWDRIGNWDSKDDNPFGNWDRKVHIFSWSHAIVSVGGECDGLFILIPRNVQSLTMTGCDGTTDLAGMGLLQYLEELVIERGKNLWVLCGGQDEEVIDIHDSPATTPSPPLFPSLRLLQISICHKLKYLFGSKFSLPHLREIKIRSCEEMVAIMATVTSPPPCPNPAFPSLEKISVEDCYKMKRVVESEWLPHFPKLREITVFHCGNMEEIIGGPPPDMTVEEIPLESLEVDGCHTMRMLFTHEWLIHLRNLRSIIVKYCGGMVEMVSGAGQSREGSMISEAGQSHGGCIMTPANDTSSSISLPELTHLCLDELPQLKSICKVLVTCDSIEDMMVDKCPELKRIPLQLRLRDDKDLPHILVEDWKRWETLTWNSLDARNYVQTYRRKVKRPGCPDAIELCPIGLDLK